MFLQQQAHIINFFLMTLDALCVLAAGIGAYNIRAQLSDRRWSISPGIFLISIAVIVAANSYIMGKFRLYSDQKPSSISSILWGIIKSIVLDFTCLSAVIFLIKYKIYSRLFLSIFAVLCFVFIATHRIAALFFISKSCRKGFNISRILLIGNPDKESIVTNILENQLSWGHKIIGRLTIHEEDNSSDSSFGRIEDLPRVLRDHAPIDEVVFALNGDRTFNLSFYLHICKQMGIPVRILPSLWESDDYLPLSIESCQGVPFFVIQGRKLNAIGLLYKRLLDLAGGLIGASIFFLMYPFIAVAIKLDSPGPVIFRQKRVGQHGRIFTLYKFRTMHADAEQRKQGLVEKNEMQGAMFKMKNDPRITRVGWWLRKTSLDEFPQFLNVLKGEMSLVGTRPPTPDEVRTYELCHLRRISAKPGITGLWQVSGRNKITDFNKVVELDCKYLDSWRFLNDIKILFKTVFVVLLRKGAV